MAVTWIDIAIASGSAAAGGFMGALGFWLVTKLETWFSQPDVRIEFGVDYPFRSRATFQDGTEGDFIRVRVRNGGKTTATNCGCYVRRITLRAHGQTTQLPSDELMMTSWVPREAGVYLRDIPAGLEFLADIAHAWSKKGKYIVAPVFQIQNKNVQTFSEHVGDFELEVVITGGNFVPATRVIRFRFDANTQNLIPIT